MSFSLFFQSLINGLNQGAIYALIALGYTMVYGIIRMINFAHGDFIMIGAYTLFYTIPLMVNAGMPAWLAVIVAIAVCAVVGVLVETFAYRPVRKAGPMSALITALAMSIFLENLAMVLFGAKPHNVQAIFSLPTVTVGGVALPLNVLLTIAIGLGMMIALQLFVKKTKLGKAMRAVPQDKDAAYDWFQKAQAQGHDYAGFFMDRIERPEPPNVLLSATRLLYHLGKIFQSNAPAPQSCGVQIDRKRLAKLRRMRMAAGHKADDHEQEQTNNTMSMSW